ncbi:MAG TPA: UDP-N-acetylglucosamine--N-acetylmuramyl-(pentapeptide) pyrophosphoryl-undecaprenol N-acetylglucosamine transferase [Holophagaceae bacterium]|nr:UDP-N-acetylglucosamine--N-acetylmuramyl-(pentapeptide) pyrophosphoryl-undecaprenol N-acetylglucosamine transferase [Holophagaceae bacterium]
MDAQGFDGALVFTGGGTGGHFFPAVALAEGARARWPERPIAFVGAVRGIEGRKLPDSGWPHLLFDVEGFLGRSPFKAVKSAWKLMRAKAALTRIWKRHRPWAVVGTGGYGAAPALLAARSLGIPYFLHESNAAPGALVKQLSPGAARVWCGMEALKALLPGADCLLAGTPVREAFRRAFKPIKELRRPFQLLVLGGSGGARAINDGMMAAAPVLLEQFPDWTLLHQAGPKEYERLKDAPRHERHALVPFIEDVAGAMEASSLVLSRSGASTCAELKAAGRGAILIPLPTSANNHQLRNAEAMAREHRVVLVQQQANLADHIEAHCFSHMGNAYARVQLAKQPEPNRAVEICLDDLDEVMGHDSPQMR